VLVRPDQFVAWAASPTALRADEARQLLRLAQGAALEQAVAA